MQNPTQQAVMIYCIRNSQKMFLQMCHTRLLPRLAINVWTKRLNFIVYFIDGNIEGPGEA